MVRKIISLLLVISMSVGLMVFPVMADGDLYTDEWITEWDYDIRELGYDGEYIFLKKYIGTKADIGIGGKATVDGVDYPVCISVEGGGGYSHYTTGINSNKDLRQITFFAVDGVPVRSELSDRLDDMFYGMENLQYVFFRGDFREDVSQAISMFEGCENLICVDVDNLDFGTCCVFKRMFYGCKSLTNATINCPGATNMEGMFYDCESLERVTINCAAGDQSRANEMFCGCSKLKEINMEGRHFSDVSDFSRMFDGCESLESIDFGLFDFSSARSLSSMFFGCSALKAADLSEAEWGSSTPDVSSMFSNCNDLGEITVSESFKPRAANNMFHLIQTEERDIKIKGSLSEEFEETVFPGLEASNRYIGQIILRSKVELEGKELRDGLFSVLYEDGRRSYRECNYRDEGNVVDLVVPVYKPGSASFTIKEYFDDRDSILDPYYLPVEIVDDIYCEDAERSKTVNIVLNTDGSLSVEE